MSKHLLHRMLKLLFVLLLVYVAGVLLLQRRLIFPASWANQRLDSSQTRGAGIAGLERLWLETDAGRTEAWLALAPQASATEPSGLVLFAHGNAELIDDQAELVRGFQALGLSVAMCEYRGFGLSEGSPSQTTILADHLQLLKLLETRPELDPERIIYYGRSLGGGVACALASEAPPAALVLQSTFESMARMARGFFVPSFLVRDPFDNRAALEAYPGPVLLMHGTHDHVIPFANAEALLAASPHAELTPFSCGHNDFPVASPKHWQRVQEFLERAGLL